MSSEEKNNRNDAARERKKAIEELRATRIERRNEEIRELREREEFDSKFRSSKESDKLAERDKTIGSVNRVISKEQMETPDTSKDFVKHDEDKDFASIDKNKDVFTQDHRMNDNISSGVERDYSRDYRRTETSTLSEKRAERREEERQELRASEEFDSYFHSSQIEDTASDRMQREYMLSMDSKVSSKDEMRTPDISKDFVKHDKDKDFAGIDKNKDVFIHDQKIYSEVKKGSAGKELLNDYKRIAIASHVENRANKRIHASQKASLENQTVTTKRELDKDIKKANKTLKKQHEKCVKETKKIKATMEMKTPNTNKDITSSDAVRDKDFAGIDKNKDVFVRDNQISKQESEINVFADSKISKKSANRQEKYTRHDREQIRKKQKEALNNAKNQGKELTKSDYLEDNKIKKTVKRKKKKVSDEEFVDKKVSQGGVIGNNNTLSGMLGIKEFKVTEGNKDNIKEIKGVIKKDASKSGIISKNEKNKVSKNLKKKKIKTKEKNKIKDGTKISKTAKKKKLSIGSSGNNAGERAKKGFKKKYMILGILKNEVKNASTEPYYNPLDGIVRIGKTILVNIGRSILKLLLPIIGKVMLIVVVILMLMMVVTAVASIPAAVVSAVGNMFAQTSLSFFLPTADDEAIKSNANYFIKIIDDKIAEVDTSIETLNEEADYEFVYGQNDPNFYTDIIALYIATMFDSNAEISSFGGTGNASECPWLIVDTDNEKTTINNIISSLYYVDDSHKDDEEPTIYIYRNNKDAYINKYGLTQTDILDIARGLVADKVSNGELSVVAGLDITTLPPYSAANAEKIFAEANKYLGYPYVWGGASPSTSFDCSGFVWYVLHQTGLFPGGRDSAQGIYNHCEPISKEQARPGDLIFFTKTYATSDAVTHIGFYAGEGKMLHCGNPIQYTSCETTYWKAHFYGYGRLKK